MNKGRSYDTMFSLNDLFCNMLLGFIVLFVIALLMIAKEQEKRKQSPETKAEFLIVVTWPSESPDDVDTYVEDPLGNIVGFNRREQGLMHLDRDDLGHKNDTVISPNGTFIFGENRETVVIRGFVPGEYVANVHMYRKEWDKPTPVTVTLQKIEPYGETAIETVVLEKTGDEHTAFRFVVGQDGTVTETNRLQKRFINKTP